MSLGVIYIPLIRQQIWHIGVGIIYILQLLACLKGGEVSTWPVLYAFRLCWRLAQTRQMKEPLSSLIKLESAIPFILRPEKYFL